MPEAYSGGDSWIEGSTRTSLRRGLLLGIGVGAGFSCIAIIRVVFALGEYSLFGHLPAIHDLRSAGWLLIWVIPGYFVGFGIAGILIAMASHLSNRVLRYTVSGFFCSTIYGAVGVSADLMDGKSPKLSDTATTIAILGLAFAAVGFVLGVWDTIRARRAASRAAG